MYGSGATVGVTLKLSLSAQWKLDAALIRLEKDGGDPERPLRRFDQAWKAKTILAGRSIRVTGGSFRGVYWRKMNDQYTRTTDNVTVPAWGGVPRIRAGWDHIGNKIRWDDKGRAHRGRWIGRRMPVVTGNVQAKLRPSGNRVAETSIMSEDTGHMYQALIASEPVILNGNTLRLGGDLPIYAERVWRDSGRNPVMFFPDDDASFNRIVSTWADGIVKAFNTGTTGGAR